MVRAALLLTKYVLALTVAVVALLISGAEVPQEATAVDKPNIIVVMTDDQDADSLRFMPVAKNRLVSRGVRFTNFFASQPLCCPNRATFLTGLYVHNHGITGNDGTQFWGRDLDQSTVGTWLKGAGYETAYFGKYLNHYEGGHVPPGWDKWQAYVGNYGQYNPVRVRTNGGWTSFDRTQIHEADYLARESVGWLKGQAGDASPKFMVVAPYTPHSLCPTTPTSCTVATPLSPGDRKRGSTTCSCAWRDAPGAAAGWPRGADRQYLNRFSWREHAALSP